MKGRAFTLIEFLIVLSIVLILTVFLLAPMGYVGYRTRKEINLYKQFEMQYPGMLQQKEFRNILNRHPTGVYPVDPNKKEQARILSVEAEAVAENIYDLEDTKELQEWLEQRDGTDNE